MAEDIQAVKEKITTMHAGLKETSYYEVLGVKQSLDQTLMNAEVTNRFRELAREWHVDKYSGYDLADEEREMLQEIFSFINTAKQVLSDPDKRASYDMELAGESVDVGAIFNAENAFRRGQTMLDAGSYKGAHEQFKIACQEQPDEQEYQAHLLYTEFALLPKKPDGSPQDMKRAKEIYDALDDLVAQLPDRDWLLCFLGIVAKGIGRTREANVLFTEALQHNPRNVMAQRQQRLVKMRKDQKKGFFAQLKEKLGLGG